jgi:hypothetical protein
MAHRIFIALPRTSGRALQLKPAYALLGQGKGAHDSSWRNRAADGSLRGFTQGRERDPVATDRRGGQSLLALGGGVVLAVSVFLPWYGLTLTSSGAASAQQHLNSVAQQFGNSTLQGLAGSVGNTFSSLVGQQIGTVSAHQSLRIISVVLLILAGVGVLLTMARLAGSGSSQPRGVLAAVGLMAAACIVFRMIARPMPAEDFFAISLRWGAWLALAGSLAIVVGDLWPGGVTPVDRPPPSSPIRPSTPPRPPGWS